MTTTTLTTGGGHVAVLDVLAGVGALVSPLPHTDVRVTPAGSLSLHEASWNVAVDRLAAYGWEPVPDEWDCPQEAGTLPDGRSAILLRGPHGEDATDLEVITALMGCMDVAAATASAA